MNKSIKNRNFKPEDHREIILWKTVKDIGGDILYQAVKACCSNTTEYIIRNCLNNNHPGKTRKIYKREREKAKENVISLRHDITFLAELLIREIYSTGKEGALECCRALKDVRNALTHGLSDMTLQEFNLEMNSLELLFSKSIEVYLKVSKHMQSLETLSEKQASECKIGCEALRSINTSLIADMEGIKNTVVHVLEVDEYMLEEAQLEILRGSMHQFFLNPVEVFIGVDLQIPLFKVFTDFAVKDSSRNLEDENDSLSVKYIINLIKRPLSKHLIIVEGPSGIGKSTLMKYILSLKNENILAVDGFIIKFDCCQKICQSLRDLIISFLPKSKRLFGEKKLYDAIMASIPLFLIDGLDEMSPQSRCIILEIMHKVEMRTVAVLCTSRAEGVEEFLVENKPTFYYCFCLQGVKASNSHDFVKKWYTEFESYSGAIFNNKKSITPLCEIYKTLDILSKNLYSHLQFPMVLALFVYLCVFSPGSINRFRNVASFYSEIISAMQWKLSSRISSKRDSLNLTDASQKVKMFFNYICQVSFAMLGNHTLKINEQMVVQLQGKCEELKISFEDSSSTFLESKIIYTPTGIERMYVFPNDTYKELLAALYLKAELTKNHSLFSLLPIGDIKNLSVYSNTIIYTAGLMASELQKQQCKQIVHILLVAANFFGPEIWLHLLRETNCNKMLAYYIAKVINLLRVNTDELQLCPVILQCQCPKLSLVYIVVDPNMVTVNTPYELNQVIYHLKGKNVAYTIKCLDLDVATNLLLLDDYIVTSESGVRCSLDSFKGCLGVTGIRALPRRVNSLFLHVELPEHCAGLVELSKIYMNNQDSFRQKKQYYIGELHISLTRCVNDTSKFLPLPNADLNAIHISRITDCDIDWAIDILRKLQPKISDSKGQLVPKAYTFVSFRLTKLTPSAIRLLIDTLADCNISINRNLMVFSKIIIVKDLQSDLKMHCKTKIGCNLLIFESLQI